MIQNINKNTWLIYNIILITIFLFTIFSTFPLNSDYKKAIEYYENNDYDAAAAMFQDIINSHRFSYLKYHSMLRLANIYYHNLDDIKNTIRLYDEILNETNIMLFRELTLNGLINIYFWEENDFDKIIELYNKNHKNINDNILLFRVGQAYYFKNQYKEAKNIFSKILDSDIPEEIFNDLYLFYGHILREEGHYTQAIIKYETLLEKIPQGNDALFYWLGYLYEKTKEYKKAIDYYQNLFQLFPNSTFTEEIYSSFKEQHILILNGNGQSGLSSTLSAYLKKNGFNKITIDNAPHFNFDTSKIKIKKPELVFIAGYLKFKFANVKFSIDFHSNAKYDIVLIVGNDINIEYINSVRND